MRSPTERKRSTRVIRTPVKTAVKSTSWNHSQSVHASTPQPSRVNRRNTPTRTPIVTRPRRLILGRGVLRMTTIGSTHSVGIAPEDYGVCPYPQGVAGTMRPDRSPERPSCGRARRRRAPVPDGVEGGERLLERADLRHGESVDGVAGGLGAVVRRDEEHRRAGGLGAAQLLRDAADGPDGTRVVDRARAGDDPAAGQVLRPQLVDDAEGEHQAGARTADLVQLELQGELRMLFRLDLHAEQGAVAALRHLRGDPRRGRRAAAPV